MPLPATSSSPEGAGARAGRGATPSLASTSAGSQTPAARSARPLRPITSSGGPRSTGRPSRPRTSRRSARRHASSTRCSTRMIVVPAARSAASRSTKARAPSGSRFAVGSSRTSRRECGASAPARASRCCCPPDRVVDCDRPNPPRPTSSSAPGTRSCIACRCQPRFSRPNATSSSTRSITSWSPGSWKTTPTGPPTSSTPSRRPGTSRPSSPARASTSVLLPDPEGPRTSRHSPGATSTSTSRNAASAAPAWVKPSARATTAPGATCPRGDSIAAVGMWVTLRQAGKPRRTPASRSPRTIAKVTSGRRTAAETTMNRKVRASTSGATPW